MATNEYPSLFKKLFCFTFFIQAEMSLAEMNSPGFRYWTEIKGERYLQIISAKFTNHYKPESIEETQNFKERLGMPLA